MITSAESKLERADLWAHDNPDEYRAIIMVARGCLRNGWKLQREGRYGFHVQALRLGHEIGFTVPHPIWLPLTYWITEERPELAAVFKRNKTGDLPEWIASHGMPKSRREQ